MIACTGIMTSSVVRKLEKLVALDSHIGIDNTPVIQQISEWLNKYDIIVQNWKRKDSITGQNIVVKIQGKSTMKSLIFVGHVDTVPANNDWNTNPFQLIQDKDQLYGLGTCDIKGGVAALIEAVLTLPTKPAYNTYLVFDGDEEGPSTGAKKFLETMDLVNPHFIFLEPSNKKVLVGQRSLLKFDVTTKGKAGHSSQATPKRSSEDNAISKMQHILSTLSKDAQELAKEEHDFLGTHTQNFGAISGGVARNVFADRCTVVMERRLLPNRDPKEEFARLVTLLKSTDPTCEITLDEIEPGFSTQSDTSFVLSVLDSLKSKYINASVGSFDAWSEAGLFAKKGEVLILGSGDLAGHAHKANESVEKAELEAYVEIFQQILQQSF